MALLKRIGSSPAVQRFAGGLIARYFRFVWATGRISLDPPDIYNHADDNLPVIFTMWHGQHFLSPFVRRPDYRVAVLISRSRDGEINAIAAEALGISTIRGSGDHNRQFHRKGGVSAFRDMVDTLAKGTTVALTADVPKVGKRAGLGVVLLARYSGRPILPVAVASHWRIDFASWDRASLNLPFSRIAVVAGEPIFVPPDCDDAMLENFRQQVEDGLNEATRRAYAIAAGQQQPAHWPQERIAQLMQARADVRAAWQRKGEGDATS